MSDYIEPDNIQEIRETAEAQGWKYLGFAATVGMSPRMWRPPGGGQGVSESHLAERLQKDEKQSTLSS